MTLRYEDPSQNDAEAGLSSLAPSTGVSAVNTLTGQPVDPSTNPWLNGGLMSAATGNTSVATQQAPPGGGAVYTPELKTLYASRSKYTTLGKYVPMIDPATPNPKYQGTEKLVVELQPAELSVVQSDILNMSETKLKELQKKLGLKPTGFPDPQTVDIVGTFLDHVSQINAMGTKKTWQQVLNIETKDGKKPWVEAVGISKGYEKPFSGSKTVTSSNVKQYSPSELRGSIEQAFTAAVGRAPTKQERILMDNAINNRSESNPVVSTRTTDYDKGEVTGTHTVTDGGVDPNQMILNEARSKEGYAEYQALNYFDTMMQALSAPGGA